METDYGKYIDIEKGIIMMKICFFTLMICTCFLSSCYAARIDGPYEGRIIDAVTRKPIEGVVVLGTWDRENPTPSGAVHHYYDAMETVTDKNGDFTIKGLGLLVLSDVIPMNVSIFKAGYEYFGVGPWASLKTSQYLIRKKDIRWEGNRVIIPLRKVTIEERGKQMSPDYPSEATEKKIRLMLREINKDRADRGLKPVN